MELVEEVTDSTTRSNISHIHGHSEVFISIEFLFGICMYLILIIMIIIIIIDFI